MYTVFVANGWKFDWDRANVAHIARHKVTPDEAEHVLKNDPIDLGYAFVDGEHRWAVLGHTSNLRIILCVWTIRGDDTIRVVTAREAIRKERMAYLQARGLLI